MTALIVTIDTLPVTGNHAYEHVTRTVKGTKKRYTGRQLTEAAKTWRSDAAWQIKTAAQNAEWSADPLLALSVTLWAYHPQIIRKGDVDGFAKLTLDAVKDALGIDDKWAMDMPVHKRFGAERLVLEIRSMPWPDGIVPASLQAATRRRAKAQR